MVKLISSSQENPWELFTLREIKPSRAIRIRKWFSGWTPLVKNNYGCQGCGTPWPTGRSIRSVDPEVDPWAATWGLLVPHGVDPDWPSSICLMFRRRDLERKMAVWSTALVGTTGPPDQGSGPHTRKGTQGQPLWWGTDVEWAPSAPPCNYLKYMRRELFICMDWVSFRLWVPSGTLVHKSKP